MRYNELTFQGRNAVLEAFRSGKTIDKLFILDGCQDGPIKSIVREAKKTDAIINYVDKERLDRLAGTGHHQGVVAIGAAYEYPLSKRTAVKAYAGYADSGKEWKEVEDVAYNGYQVYLGLRHAF